jgi:hypothetical protein
MKKDQITVELLMRTVFEMKRLPENEHKSLKDLARPAYELLLECERTIANFEEGDCTFQKGVAIVTGYKRVREEHIRLFELFYEQTYALDPEMYRGSHQFYQWRINGAMPLRWCLETAPKFAKWNRRRRSEIERQKRIGSAKPKWDEKIDAASKQKEEDF